MIDLFVTFVGEDDIALQVFGVVSVKHAVSTSYIGLSLYFVTITYMLPLCHSSIASAMSQGSWHAMHLNYTRAECWVSRQVNNYK